jgi:hypothetical protein
MNFKSLIFGTCLLVGTLAVLYGWVRSHRSLATIAGADIAKAAAVRLPSSTTAFIMSGVIDSGVFVDGAQFGGTFGIDGPNFGVNLTVSGINGFSTYDTDNPADSVGFYNHIQPGDWQGVDSSDASAPGDELSVALVLPPGATNLNNYTGGALRDATTSNWGPAVPYYSKNVDPSLVSDFATVVPEPGSTGLLGAGLSALGLVLRRRFVKD